MVSVEAIRARHGVRIKFGLVPILLVLAVCVVVFAGVGFSLQSEAASGGTLSVSLSGPSRFINPLLATTDVDEAASSLVFRGLTRIGPRGQVLPDLASNWTVSNAGRTYVFHLRPGLEWSNGRPVTAADVVYSYGLLARPSFPAHTTFWAQVVVHAVTGEAVEFELPSADYTFPVQTAIGIVPKDFAGSAWPVGAGPFRLNRVTGSEIALAARHADGANKSLLSGIDFRTSGSATSSLLSCHLSFGRRGGGTFIPVTRELNLVLNLSRLNDIDVRRAIIAAVGARTQLLSPALTWPSGQSPPSLSRLKNFARLMQSDGWNWIGGKWTKNGQPINLRIVTGQGGVLNPVLSRTVASLRHAGFGVTLERASFPQLVRKDLYPGNFDGAIVDMDFGSSDYLPGEFWSSASSLNFGRVRDAYVNQLIAKVPESPSFAQRNALRRQIGGRVLSDGAAVGLARAFYACRVSPSLHGYVTPQVVSGAGGLVSSVRNWYVNTRLVLRNPF